MTVRRLAVPALGVGVFMALYLLTRPYGDAGTSPADMGVAFASPWWLFAHVCGMVALACAASLGMRIHDVAPMWWSVMARWSGLAGLVLVLPYYGAEAFALHVLGSHAVAGDVAALAVVPEIRGQAVAMTMFGVGLLLFGISAVTTAVTWSRVTTTAGRWALWPLAVCVALVLPQFFLPVAGRMAFGVLTLLAALVAAMAAIRSPRGSSPSSGRRAVPVRAAGSPA